METQFKIRCRGLIVDAGELLVVEHVHKKGWLALPGGHLDGGEDLHTALTRELTEELGVVPLIGPLLYIHTFTQPPAIQTIEFLFWIHNAAAYRSLPIERSHAYELAEVRWVTAVEEMPLRPLGVWNDFATGGLTSEQALSYLVDGVKRY